jgi:CDP-glucose 4,6-dehydratase
LVRRLLEAGADLICLVRVWVPQSELVRAGLIEKAKVVRGDVRDHVLLERALGEYEIDTVIHLAAQTIVTIANRNPVSTFETNIGGTWALLEACRRSPTVRQIVVASSDKAYGDQENLPYDERNPLQGQHPYDVSKSCADLIAHAYGATYRLPVAITRCGNFYGGGDLNWNRIVPGTIRSVLRGQRPVIRSDGNYVRDYIYVEDAAAAYMLLAEQLSARPELYGEAFNFSNEIQVTVLDLVRRILLLMGSDLSPDVRGEASHEIRRQYLSAAKARDLLAWKPLVDLDGGLRKTIDWYRRFFADE